MPVTAPWEVVDDAKESPDRYRELIPEEFRGSGLRELVFDGRSPRERHDPFKKYDHLSDEEFEKMFPMILKVQWW